MVRLESLIYEIANQFNNAHKRQISEIELKILLFILEKELRSDNDFIPLRLNYTKYINHPHSGKVERAIESARNNHVIHINDNGYLYLCNCPRHKFEPELDDGEVDLIQRMVNDTVGMSKKDIVSYYHNMEEVESTEKYGQLKI